uniref:Uncharacterized protein n=1 Tax=Nicotiana tabacum TaxID=4097 RepID=A0A1S4CJF1_TOBAC|nr:PREDICTED: uncharacterized protein LOC107819697 [Nicotiana tabacum]
MDQIPGALPVLKGLDSKKYTQLPYKPSTAPKLVPKRFKMPSVPKYDGTSDPQEHITTYTTSVKGNDLAPYEIESILLKKFGETLMRGALTRLTSGPEKCRPERPTYSELHKENLSNCESSLPGPKRREYLSRLFRINGRLKHLPRVGIREVQTLLENRRRSSRGWFLPYERTEGRDRGFWSADRIATNRKTDRGRKNRSLQDKNASGTRDPSYPRLSEYNYNVSVVELVSAMRNIKEARLPKLMRSDPSHRDPKLLCEYHKTNGHRTRNCRHVREEMATLLKNGHLREFLGDRAKNNYGCNWDNAEPSKAGEDPLRQTINLIFGGMKSTGSLSRQQKRWKYR